MEEEKLKKIFGKNVRKYRKIKKLTQEQLAEMLDVSVVFISKVENGYYGIDFKKLAKLSKILDVEPSVLFLES